jgi:hypothetical protein
VAKQKRVWPPWWDWPLELKPYTYMRLKERDCSEIELRRMMEYGTDWKPARLEGRWVIETRFRRGPWKVVVEPAPEKQRLVVVTAYPVEKPK